MAPRQHSPHLLFPSPSSSSFLQHFGDSSRVGGISTSTVSYLWKCFLSEILTASWSKAKNIIPRLLPRPPAASLSPAEAIRRPFGRHSNKLVSSSPRACLLFSLFFFWSLCLWVHSKIQYLILVFNHAFYSPSCSICTCETSIVSWSPVLLLILILECFRFAANNPQ